jgi:hypothetical protein
MLQWKWTQHDSTVYTSRFKKCCVNCELLYYPSSEFKSAFNVYSRHDEGAAGLSCTELSIWEFPFLRGACRQGGNSTYMILCEWDAPEGHPGQCCVHHQYARILSTSFTSVSIFSVWCYSSVFISVSRTIAS